MRRRWGTVTGVSSDAVVRPAGGAVRRDEAFSVRSRRGAPCGSCAARSRGADSARRRPRAGLGPPTARRSRARDPLQLARRGVPRLGRAARGPRAAGRAPARPASDASLCARSRRATRSRSTPSGASQSRIAKRAPAWSATARNCARSARSRNVASTIASNPARSAVAAISASRAYVCFVEAAS